MPNPGPSGTMTQPSTKGGRSRTRCRIRGDGLRQYSTKFPSGQAAIHCSEAARLIPVLKQWGTQRLPASWDKRETSWQTVKPPQKATSGWMTCNPRSISSSKPQLVTSPSPAAIGTGERAQSSAYPFKSRPGKRSEEHTSELQSHSDLVCRLLLEKKKK